MIMEHVPANSESAKTNASSEQGGHSSRQLLSSAHVSVSTASSPLIDDSHHRLRIWPQRGVSAVYPVPNIVVEYVPQAYSESGANRIGSSSPHIRCLTPPHSARWSTQITRPSVSRQARALSDSSVHELEKLVVGSEVVNVHSEHVPGLSMQRQLALGRYDAEVARTMTGSHRASTVSRLELTRPTSSYLKPEPLHTEQSLIHYGPSSPRFFGPERSPKAYWLRRHSDSNLASGHTGVSASVRTEPYPIRSHSTGDSALSSMSLSVFNPPDVVLSDSEMSSNIKSTAVKYNSRTSRGSSTAADVADSEIACRVFNTTTCEVAADRTSELSQHREADKPAPNQYLPTDVLDEAPTDEHGNAERGEVLIEKRLKLKKYLQTRYQMSLTNIRQSLDNDDVFVDRFSSPGPCTPPVKQSFQTTAGHNIGLLHAVLSPVPFTGLPHQPIQPTSQSLYEYSRSTACHTKSLSASGSPNCWLHHEHGGGPIRMSRSDERISVKAEPLSPGTVSSGASVFVFPPPSLVTKSFEPVQPVHLLLGGKLSTAAASSSVASAAAERRRSDVPPVVTDMARPAAAVFSDQHQFQWSRSSHGSQPSSSRLSEYQTSKQLRTLPSFGPAVMELPSSQTATKVSAASAPLEMHRLPSPTSVLQFFTGQPYSLSEISRHRKEPDWPVHHRMSSERMQLEDTSSLACPVCSIAFSSYKCLSDHMALHVSGSSLSSTEPTAAKHVDVSGLVSKPVHLCPICQRTFSRGDMLTRHVRLHTGVRPYECTLCSQVFSRSDHLTTHQRTHTGEKPYRCPVCAYAAPRRDMVTRHARIHETSLLSSGRRGRRTASVSACANVNIPVAVESRMVVPSRIDLPGMALRRHFSESGSGTRGLPKTLVGQQGRENETVLSRPRQWSLAGSVDSAEGSVSTPPPLPPVTCRAWSTTSAESFESYPGACRTASSSVSSSVTAESPDVFTLHSRHFRWGVDIPVTLTEAVAQSEDARMPIDVAGVMPAFQKCSVTSPRQTSKHDSDVSDVE